MPNGSGVTVKGRNFLANVGTVFPPIFFFEFTAIPLSSYRYNGFLSQELLTDGISVFHEKGIPIWSRGAILRPTTTTPLNPPFTYLVYVYCPSGGKPYSWGY